ncbi:hypothetical protein ACSHT0_17240 [Tepidicaulis sp. LMO-SS28]|uniref:hypothetical protein n=1 Tax=Tepidicaulis sp. LMO-SS28 TaxID=3447455 RepID=UPI003EE167FB
MASLNEMLANLVSAWNALFAGFIVLVVALIGATSWGAFGFLLGAVVGAAFATLICGALAIFIDIRRLLKKIVDAETSTAS